jgi:hypothetical protein
VYIADVLITRDEAGLSGSVAVRQANSVEGSTTIRIVAGARYTQSLPGLVEESRIPWCIVVDAAAGGEGLFRSGRGRGKRPSGINRRPYRRSHEQRRGRPSCQDPEMISQ